MLGHSSKRSVKKNVPGAGLSDGGAYPAMGKGLDWGPDGRHVVAEPHHGSYDVVPKRGGSAKLLYHPKTGSTPRPRHDLGVHASVEVAQSVAEKHHAGVGTKKSTGFQLVSLDDYYDLIKGQAGREAYHADAAQRRTADPGRTAHVDRPPPATSDVASRLQNERRVTKFPRRMKPTVRMKPISDAEAMQHIRSGTYSPNHQKSLVWLAALKALATGYGKASGGGALKAANREPPSLGPDGRLGRADVRFRRRSRSGKPNFGPDGRPGEADGRRLRRSEGDLDLEMSLDDLNRATKIHVTHARGHGDAMLAREIAVRDPHADRGEPTESARVPPRDLHALPAGPGAAHFDAKKSRPTMVSKKSGTAKTYPTTNASARPSTSSEKSPLVVDGGGATELSNSIDNVVIKSEGATMANTNFNDLFKAELGTADDEVLADCPHCEAPITKGDLAKAHKGKGKVTHVTGPKHGKSGAHVREQNPEGGTMRGGDGRGVHTPSRGVPGAKKIDEVRVQSASGHKGKLPGVSKAGTSRSDDSSSGDADSGDTVSKSEQRGRPVDEPVKKAVITIRGTEHVQWIDDGSDARLAKAILEGSLGGTPPTQPLDLNHDATRLLI